MVDLMAVFFEMTLISCLKIKFHPMLYANAQWNVIPKNHKSEGLTKFVANKFSNLVQSRRKRWKNIYAKFNNKSFYMNYLLTYFSNQYTEELFNKAPWGVIRFSSLPFRR